MKWCNVMNMWCSDMDKDDCDDCEECEEIRK